MYVTSSILSLAVSFAFLGHASALPIDGAAFSAPETTLAFASAGTTTARDPDIAVMLAALNQQRVSNGLEALDLDPRLCKIARSYASRMATERFFGHTSPAGDTPFNRMDRAHYRYGYAGENIALDQDPASAAAALWHSVPHRENILEPHFAKVGIGAIRSAAGEIFVEDFSD